MSAIPTDFSALTDAKLMEAVAQSHSEPAFAQLVDRHASWVYAAALRQLGDAHLAEDATQAVFVLLFQRAGKMGSHRKISGWLFMAVHYTVRSMQRAMRRRRHYERNAAREHHLMVEHPDSTSSVSGIAPNLDREVACLPERYRAAVVLRFYQGLGFAQVAADLGITESTARKRVTRGVQRLKRRLGAQTTEAAVGSAALVGVPVSVAVLKAQVIQTATSAAVIPHIAVAAKGAVSLMTMAKAKIAAAVILAAVVVTGTTGAAVKWVASSAKAAESKPAPILLADNAPQAAVPASKSPFDEAYALGEGEILRRIPPPFIPQRMDFYRTQNPSQAQAMPKGADGMIIHWRDGKPQQWGMTFGGGGYTVEQLLEYFQNQYPQDLDGDKTIMKTVIPGDFAVPDSWDNDQMRGAVEQMLAETLNKDIRLTVKDVQKPVIVISGQWHDIKTVHPEQRPDQIEIYGRDFNKNHRYGGGGSGSLAEMSKWLGSWINEPIILDVTDAPPMISYHLNDMGDGTPDSQAHTRDKDLNLQHIADQTGLSWKEETRKVQVMWVEVGGKS